jgi:hypothetical protein
VRTPWSGYLEAGLLIRYLRQAGDLWVQVDQQSRRIDVLREDLREAHLAMMDVLVGHLLGERADCTFSSEDLRAAGVDDRQRPVLSDYPDPGQEPRGSA